MVLLIGCKGMLGTEIARQLSENKIDFVGTDIDVDITKCFCCSQSCQRKL